MIVGAVGLSIGSLYLPRLTGSWPSNKETMLVCATVHIIIIDFLSGGVAGSRCPVSVLCAGNFNRHAI